MEFFKRLFGIKSSPMKKEDFEEASSEKQESTSEYVPTVEIMKEEFDFHYTKKPGIKDPNTGKELKKASFLLIESKKRVQNGEYSKVFRYLGESLRRFENVISRLPENLQGIQSFPEKETQTVIYDYYRDLATLLNAIEKHRDIHISAVHDVDKTVSELRHADHKQLLEESREMYENLRDESVQKIGEQQNPQNYGKDI